MSQKSSVSKIELPSRNAKPRGKDDLLVPPFEILNPGGEEIYKMSARYPTKPPLGPCTFRIFWKGGPFPADVTIYLIDIKSWVAIAVIAPQIPNVPTGDIGVFKWSIPVNFRPSDDCDLPAAVYPDKYGRYQIYIQDVSQTTWTYGPEFAITWSE
jgi:hypothetical protein